MRSLTRRGFTLIELLVGLVILALFAMVVVSVVRGTAGVASRSLASLANDRTRLALRTFLQQDLRDGIDTEVALLASARVALSRPIGEALPCADSAGTLLIADSSWRGTRLPVPDRDDVLLLVNSFTEQWLRLELDSVGSGQCPGNNAPAIRLRVAAHSGSAIVIRVVEPVELSAYRSGAADWFGLTPASHTSTVQPFAGPLTVGTTSFSWLVDRLDVVFTVVGAGATTVRTPLTAP